MSMQLQAADGHRFDAFVATPQGTPRGALVVLQEIFGVNSHIRAVAHGYADEGYVAIAPALFERLQPGVELGYTEDDVKRGRELKAAAMAQPERVLQDIAAAIAEGAQHGKVGIVGYCWGGLLTWLSACRLDGLSAAISYYGAGIPDQATLKPRCPVLMHFGERDSLIPLDRVEAFQWSRPEVEVHVYPADHGFNCDQRAAFEPQSAALARRRSLDFLQRHVG
ncbi:dienelactone hydrolase family protein [Azohydromonas caseinilytica]|uniref:Dienelactone hydrolase family protein n=1 Tax=Azohydromonas caseinilytica TaxID=2728836 RepID=A0A848FAI0_9BURK|nr:dienelactone hydrolase family protein [Azohydromonas caseinilytica]NML16332.1 dienelactone hydrolase family protein [Azohydromonas caseinilytica]